MGMDQGSPASPLFIAPNATVLGDVSLSAGTGIWFGAVVRADKDKVTIGEGSNIQDNAVIHTSRGFPVIIGEKVSVGHGAILHGCRIGDRVLVGMGAIVMNGAQVGEGSILGAGTVVTEGTVIPPNSVVLGVPGKVIRQTNEEQQKNIVANADNYMDLARSYRNA
jgi:carbonic anhydrase/acetyltransferase-like protein (isoleucine patch superfamily)